MDCEKVGLDRAITLSYSAVDESGLETEKKRSLIYSLCCFRCIFDNRHLENINPLLKKYNCVFAAEQDEACLPHKLPLYEMVYSVISLPNVTTEIKALYYIVFPFIPLIGAPHDTELYYKIRDILVCEQVFLAVLDLHYSIFIADSVKELWAQDMPNIVVDWLLPYIDFKNELTDKGISRDVERFERWLAKGKFSLVFEGSEKLLNSFPDDEDLFLINIAARISLDISGIKKEKLLQETIVLIEEYLTQPTAKKPHFLYYHALALLGLKRLDESLDKFNECLELKPNFEPALLMKKAIDKLSKQ